MIQSPLMQLENIEINSFNFGFTKKPRKRTINIHADNLDFDFIPQANKKDPDKKRILFNLKTKSDAQGISINLSLTYSFNFTEEKSEEDKNKFIISGLLPQIISFCRGYLYSVSSNLPARIILPPINVIESVKEKIQEPQGEITQNVKEEKESLR